MQAKMNHKLSLEQHCIETEIKKHYNRAVFDYFKMKGRDARDLGEKIELFREALEAFDFGKLRGRHPDLRGNSNADAGLYRDETGRLLITINGVDIEP